MNINVYVFTLDLAYGAMYASTYTASVFITSILHCRVVYIAQHAGSKVHTYVSLNS